jgi:hypothetical protein
MIPELKPGEMFEEKKLQQEGELRREELALKEREVAAKERELERSRWLNPTVIGLFAAALGLAGNLVVALLNNRGTVMIQHATTQSNLIVQAVSTGDYDKACRNIRSLINLGILDDPSGKLGRCNSVPSSIPVLPPQTSLTYMPYIDVPGNADMNVIVDRIDSSDNARVHVQFQIPKRLAKDKLDRITVYAAKYTPDGQRIEELDLPTIRGHWHAEDQVEFDINIAESYLNDKVNTPVLRFCVGSQERCAPSTNLLLSPEK